MTDIVLTSRSPEETERIGHLLGDVLKPGTTVALTGELGGGKTCFARGVVAGAAPQSSNLVASPTFAIMNEYPGDPPVHHFDFYRLTGAGECSELGFEEYLTGPGICLIEWPDRLGNLLPEERICVRFEAPDGLGRIISITAFGLRCSLLLEQFSVRLRDADFL